MGYKERNGALLLTPKPAPEVTRAERTPMKAKLNDAQARAYIAGESSEPVHEIERLKEQLTYAG